MSSSGRFPPINENSVSRPISGSAKRINGIEATTEHLPHIPAGKGAHAYVVASGRGAGKESALVVETSKSMEAQEPALPEEWVQMRVNPPQQDDSHMTKLAWENQIAKHILSLFASSHAVRNLSEGNALLDFVEVDRSAVKSPEKAAPKVNNTVNLLHTRPPMRPPTVQEGGEEEEGHEGHDEGHPASDQVTHKKKKKVKRKKGKQSQDNSAPSTRRSTPSRPEGVSESDYAIAERVLLRVRAEAQLEEEGKGKAKAREKDKYRITNTIRLKDGQEIVVRGTPRCYPIWFVSTGDVFADWTALPGGTKLQAHLNVLYEQQKYSDYLGVIETIITEMWRKVRFGHEEFTVGSFGHSAAASASHSGTNTGTNTGANTARTRSNSNAGHTSNNQSRRNSHSGGTALPLGKLRTGRDSASPSSSPVREGERGSPGEADSQFGAAIIWEDAGEEGLIPKKVVPSLSPVRERPDGEKKEKRKGRRKPSAEHSQSPEVTSHSAEKGGILTGLGQDSQHEVPEPLLPPSKLIELWKQLVLACIAMGILYLEKKQPDQAMLLFKRAEEWAANDEIVPQRKTRKELKGHARDAISYYFFKRKKSIAALGYSEQAMALYEETDNLDGIAVCLLHVAAVYSQIGDFKEAHKKLFQFLAMVEAGRLASADATPKQLCMVAIGYHNLAVVQLKLAMPDLACKNSQNARKIARLCLSYSNRWIDTFQYTHEICIADIKYELSTKQAKELTPAQLALVIELSEALFDPYSDINQDAAVV